MRTDSAESRMEKERIRSAPCGAKDRPAFTLIELLVVVAIIAILAAILLPVLAGTKQKAQGTTCLSNMRQLQTAWHSYPVDHEDQLPPIDDTEQAGKDAQHPSWVAGWLRTANESGDKSDGTNSSLLVGPQYTEFGSIGSYIQNPDVYRCPGDKSRRVRSMSMNAYMNGAGRWNNSNYVTFRKYSEISNPAQNWVFVDEREDSINDGYFAVEMDARYVIIDYPARYHNGSGVLTFADGHAEQHRWLEGTTMPPLQPGEHLSLVPRYTSPGDRDMKWLVDRTTIKRR